MNEIERRDEIPSASKLTKLGITAIGYTAGGVFLFLLNIAARLRGLGLVIGGVVCVVGIASLLSKDPADRKAGVVITAAGALAVLSRTNIPVITAISGTLLSIGAIGLLALGIWNGIKFFIGLKKRS
jgi:Fe2+ transport system protein FeoA